MVDVFNKIESSSIISKISYISNNKKKTYEDILIKLRLVKKVLNQEKIKLRRIGILLDQGFSYGAVLTAVPLSDNVGVLLSKKWKSFENIKVINSSEVDYIITDQPFINNFKTNLVRKIDNLFLLKTAKNSYDLSKKNDAIIIYSSGTTGSSKGVVLTKNSISNNVISVSKYLKLNSRDVSLIYTPTCYAFSLSQTLTHLYSNACLIPFEKIIFPQEILNNIKVHKVTGLTGPPASFELLCNISKKNYNSIRYAQVGGTPFAKDLALKIKKIFPKSKILNVYGCSENSPRVSYYYLNNKNLNLGLDEQGYYCIGKSVGGTTIKIKKEKKKIYGEILVKGNSLMDRYWKNKALKKKKFENGYFKTGDIGFFKNNNLYLVGRKDFIINVGNEKVSPEEVENIINNNKNILSSVVYRKKNNVYGSVVVADIVLRKKINKNKILSYLHDYLSNFKIPKEINFVKKIKKNLYGKIDRKYYEKK